MKKRNSFILIGLILPILSIVFSFTSLQTEDNPILQSIIKKYNDYFLRLPQQKVYLQLDKNHYNADETLWFKASLLNAENHRPDSSCTNLYVELINPSGYIVQSKLVRMTGGFGNGDFSFQDTIPEGVYKIRAFTNWMRNFSDAFYFEREIYLANAEFSHYVTREELHKIKRERRKNAKLELSYDIQFLPEGGHLLSGVENKLGFKALNDLGHGFPVKGTITDSKGTKIADFKGSELGMGSVSFTPLLNEKYIAVVEVGENEKPLKISIPDALEFGVNIAATSNNGKIRIRLVSNFSASQLPPNTAYFLIGQTRGKIVFTKEFDLKNPENIYEIATGLLPDGILHLTLFNVYSQPVSERLVFVNNQNELKINLGLVKSITTTRDKMSFSLKVSDKSNNPVKGSFALSIANSDDFSSGESMLSNLLLSSDLNGKIETPYYYFTDWSPEKQKQLDNLMLTQGWRRFIWKNLMSDIKLTPKYENEKGIIISGKVTKEFFGIPLRDIKVTLTILNEFNDVFTVRSGERGLYRFENLDYQDTVSVSIEAVRASGRHNLILGVDEMPEMKDKEMHYKTNQTLTHRGEKGQWVPPADPAKNDPYAERNNKLYRIHEEPSASNVIIIDERTQHYQSVGQILEGRIPGVNVNGNNVNIRGNGSGGNSNPLFLVDGMPVDADFAMNMNPFDVERIEILKGPETAVYGSRGGNGVIAIYTKRGKFMKKGVLEFQMLGYATPKEYYNPKFEYRVDDVFEDDRRTILWIPTILIDANGEATATFYTSDVKGNFTIRAEGISNEGVPGIGETRFEVK
jgi:TonB-dependent SusC/RagA subfamily outer membrane receptor